MDYLRNYAEEYGLARIVELLAGRSNVQGAILTLDDWWLAAWRSTESGRSAEWERWYWSWRHFGTTPNAVGGPEWDSSSWIPRRRPDLQWRPHFWEDYCADRGLPKDMPPIRLVVRLRPPKSGEDSALPELPETRLAVTYEVRPLARLSASQRASVRPVVGGISIGSGAGVCGTLGGIAEDRTNGQRFGMTCAHVASASQSIEQPALRDDPGATSIGTTMHTIKLQSCAGTGPCNPYSTDPHITSVDTALIGIKPGIPSSLEIHSEGPLAGLVTKTSMMPGQEVIFEGRTSGHRIAEVGGLAVFYRLQIGGLAYCFRDLFEVRWRSQVRALFGAVVQAGDSGAWVCAETDNGLGWCGQIIGEDRHVGYAAFAENISDEWGRLGKHLRIA